MFLSIHYKRDEQLVSFWFFNNKLTGDMCFEMVSYHQPYNIWLDLFSTGYFFDFPDE